MTDQELFDRVAAHLLKQKERSVANGGTCLYRNGGLSCAIGALIPEDRYREEMEGQGVTLLLMGYPDLPFAGCDISLMRSLQNMHDCWTPPSWPERLEAIAAEYNLEFKPC